jgi:hypothetical protein
MIMVEQTLPDPEELLASMAERQRHMFAAGRKAMLDVVQTYAQTASAFADSQEQLAAASEVEGVSRFLLAQASFTREVLDATVKFVNEAIEE